MARPLRIEYEGAFYHVTARGNDRKRIYYYKSDYEKFKVYLKEAQEKHSYVLHCYVLMTNHYHLIIETPIPNLSRVMHSINGSYTNYVNIKRQRSGHLFQGRYKAILIDKDSYLLELSRYLHLNPVKAKMVETPEDYPYSSYRSYISKDKESMVYRELILGMVSGDKENVKHKYRLFVEKAIGVELKNPFDNVYGGMILGGKRFIKETLSRLKEEDLQKEDISHRRVLKSAYRFEKIIDSICVYFGISRSELWEDKNKEYRNIAICLLKKYTGHTNRQIGQLFKNISYSGIAKIYQRFPEKIKEDKVLKKKIGEIMRLVSNVKG